MDFAIEGDDVPVGTASGALSDIDVQQDCGAAAKGSRVARSIEVRRLAIRHLSKDWSSFAMAHGGSWRSHVGHLRLLRLRMLPSGKLFAFEAFATDGPAKGTKIAQCMISARGNNFIFEDGLQIADGYESCRKVILEKLLACFPAGHITYGWAWSLDNMPIGDFVQVPGTTNHQSRDVIVHSVNLANWGCWDSYYRSISTNVRRNVKRADQADRPVEVIHASGFAAIRLIPQLVKVRMHTLDRVELEHPAWRMALSYLASILTMSDCCQIAIARKDGMPLAGLFGYEFGNDFYYWHGGSVETNNGASWKLLTEAVRRWKAKRPGGQFILGYSDDSLPGYRREGLHRQRESLRKSDYLTHIISFDWTPVPAK